MKFFELFEKRLTIGYIKEFLHKRGIATNDIDDKTVSFKLYDYDWFVYYEADRLSIYIDVEDTKELYEQYSICNIINKNCWIVRCRYVEREMQPKTKIYLNFYCEFICDKRRYFEKLYNFSLVALVDAIKMNDSLCKNTLPF